MTDHTPKNVEYKDFSLAAHMKGADQNQFVKAQFEVTYGCNLHCLHCYTDPLNKPELLKKEMSYEDAIYVLDQLHKDNVLWLCFTGGEVFARKDFMQIYDYAFEKGFLITLFTNGTLVTEEIADHFAEKPPFNIEISFHGATAKSFDHITQGKGSFDNCIKGIKALQSRNLPVKLKTKGMNLNENELEDIKALVEELGYEFKMNSILYPRLDGDTSAVDYRIEANKLVDIDFNLGGYEEDCKHSAVESNETLENLNFSPSHEVYRCGCGTLQVHIDPYGMVGACTWQRENRFHIREKSIRDGMAEISKKIENAVYDEKSPCFDCKAAYYCEKMPEMAAYESGDVQKPIDHFCDVAFAKLDKTKQKIVEYRNQQSNPTQGLES